MQSGEIVAVARDSAHRFSKLREAEIALVAGRGVAGDAHQGVTVKHRSRAATHPRDPNLRQVHLIQAELFDELAEDGFTVAPADLGENVTTRGIDLLALPRGAELRIGDQAVVALTGLRTPCRQIDRFQPGLLAAVAGRGPDGAVVLKAGVMSIVVAGGIVRPGDRVTVTLPPRPHRPLERV